MHWLYSSLHRDIQLIHSILCIFSDAISLGCSNIFHVWIEVVLDRFLCFGIWMLLLLFLLSNSSRSLIKEKLVFICIYACLQGSQPTTHDSVNVKEPPHRPYASNRGSKQNAFTTHNQNVIESSHQKSIECEQVCYILSVFFFLLYVYFDFHCTKVSSKIEKNWEEKKDRIIFDWKCGFCALFRLW